MDDETVKPVPIVDVSTNKTADKSEYFIDDLAIWTITVNNAGNASNASGVKLTDILPDGFEYISSNATQGAYSNETNVWTIDNMTNGTSVTLTITSRVVKVGNYTNNASVVSNEDDWNLTNNDDNETVEVVPLPDPVKTVDNSTPYYHGEVVYNLTIRNVGSNEYSDNLTVIDSLPEGLEYIGPATIVNGTFVGEEIVGINNITWVITGIPAKSNAVISVRVKVNALGELTNNLTLIGPNGTSQMVNETINPVPIVDLSTNKTSDKDAYFIDDIVTWTITVNNAGNGTNATNVTLRDLLPSQFEFIDYDASEGTSYDNETGLWTIGNMTNGTSVTLIIIARAVEVVKEVTNNASVTCNEDEWNLSNNDDNKTVEIVDIPDPIKTVSNNTPYYHDIVEYTLTIENRVDVIYTNNLTVVDSLPEGLEFIETVGHKNCDFVGEEIIGNNNVTWVITNITAKGNATITVKVKVNAIGDLTNNLTLIAPNGTAKMDDETVTPKPIVDLNTTIDSDKDEYFVDDIAVWTITVSNADNASNASGVNLSELFPNEFFEFINATPSQGTYDDETGIWTIDNMTNGTTVTLTIVSRAKTPATDINNSVNVSCVEDEWDYDNNVADKLVDIVPLPEPVKTVNNDTPYYGDTVEYNLTITNVGSNDYSDDLTVVDSLPEGLEFIETVGISGADSLSESQDGQKVTWVLTNIGNGSSAVITVRVKVNDIVNLTNNLTVIGPRGSETTVNCTVSPIPLADLEVNKTNDHIDEINHIGTTVNWTITVTNNGPNDAVNAIANDILPDGVTYVSDSVSGAYDPDTGIWTIGTIASGDSRTIIIETVVTKSNITITNEVNVSSDTLDLVEENNYDNSSIDVEPEADLEVTVVVSNSTPHKGDNITWTITVTNHGPDTAINTTLFNDLPDGVVYISDDSNGTFDPDTGIWTIGDLPVGDTVTFVITTMVNTTNATLVDSANVSSDTYDPNMDNNLDDDVAVVPPEADLEVTVVVSNSTPHKGDNITWTITVTNHGPDTAINTTLFNDLPDGVVYISDDSNGTFDPDTGIWTIGDLPVGDTVTFVITTMVNTTNATLVDSANVSSDTYDPVMANNFDDDLAVVPPEADLEIIVDIDKEKAKVGDDVTVTFTVINHGPDSAINSRAYVEIPESLRILGFTPSKGTYNPNTGIWTIGDLAPGEEVTLTVFTKALKPGVIVCNASVESDTYDPNLSNNRDSDNLTVEEVPPEVPVDEVPPAEGITMLPTGNPVAMVLLALFAVLCVNIRRRL